MLSRFLAIDIHDADVRFDVACVLDPYSPAVRRGVLADSFDSEIAAFRRVEIDENVSIDKQTRIRDVSDKSNGDGSCLVAFLHAVQDALEALACCRAAFGIRLDVERNVVLRVFRYIDDQGAVLERSVCLVGAGNLSVEECESRTIMSLDRYGCGGGFPFDAGRNGDNLERVGSAEMPGMSARA